MRATHQPPWIPAQAPDILVKGGVAEVGRGLTVIASDVFAFGQ
ncbi:hypothetical protein ENSA5_19110 [Enhygromyxa salina]|uniref:Uncharacterized protein n=1 Tax=Enhygromyxa salina TaxID=215803 RepID=A0A2S9YD54_9BACT|nr:hypothetical protein [Enhygromyxa salina]PRQ02972.1 hypothetical protein ENSA5_19110 [Enhygromyxa salina]